MIPRESEENSQEAAKVSEVGELRKELVEEKARAEANLAGWQRERADFINYKRRVEQEMEDISKCAASELIFRILPVLDDFERALGCLPSGLGDVAWVDGVRAVKRKLRSILESKGLSEIKALGEPFDPNLHEAVMTGVGEEGTVVGEMEKGYKLHDKVLRPTKVIVGGGEEKPKEE